MKMSIFYPDISLIVLLGIDFFFCSACGILVLQPGIESATPYSGSTVLTTGQSGKVCYRFLE